MFTKRITHWDTFKAMLGLTPFKAFWPKFYIGRVKVGTPYFLPRVCRDNPDKPGYMTARPRRIGFDFVGLGWKTKWKSDNYRHEWNPVYSFVFFGLQIALILRPPHETHYWECFLYYALRTEGKDRVSKCREGFPCTWIRGTGESKESVDYYELILKDKYNNHEGSL